MFNFQTHTTTITTESLGDTNTYVVESKLNKAGHHIAVDQFTRGMRYPHTVHASKFSYMKLAQSIVVAACLASAAIIGYDVLILTNTNNVAIKVLSVIWALTAAVSQLHTIGLSDQAALTYRKKQ